MSSCEQQISSHSCCCCLCGSLEHRISSHKVRLVRAHRSFGHYHAPPGALVRDQARASLRTWQRPEIQITFAGRGSIGGRPQLKSRLGRPSGHSRTPRGSNGASQRACSWLLRNSSTSPFCIRLQLYEGCNHLSREPTTKFCSNWQFHSIDCSWRQSGLVSCRVQPICM